MRSLALLLLLELLLTLLLLLLLALGMLLLPALPLLLNLVHVCEPIFMVEISVVAATAATASATETACISIAPSPRFNLSSLQLCFSHLGLLGHFMKIWNPRFTLRQPPSDKFEEMG